MVKMIKSMRRIGVPAKLHILCRHTLRDPGRQRDATA